MSFLIQYASAIDREWLRKMPIDTLSPTCGKCQNRMVWVSEQEADDILMQVFHCETCDRYAATSPDNPAKGAATGL